MVALITTPGNDALISRLLSSLGRANASILTLAHTGTHISMLLPEQQVDTVVRTLHHDLGLA
jgi:aspartokinase